jgi:hypothetical protein
MGGSYVSTTYGSGMAYQDDFRRRDQYDDRDRYGDRERDRDRFDRRGHDRDSRNDWETREKPAKKSQPQPADDYDYSDEPPPPKKAAPPQRSHQHRQHREQFGAADEQPFDPFAPVQQPQPQQSFNPAGHQSFNPGYPQQRPQAPQPLVQQAPQQAFNPFPQQSSGAGLLQAIPQPPPSADDLLFGGPIAPVRQQPVYTPPPAAIDDFLDLSSPAMAQGNVGPQAFGGYQGQGQVKKPDMLQEFGDLVDLNLGHGTQKTYGRAGMQQRGMGPTGH